MPMQSVPSASGPLSGLSVVELGDGTSGPYAAKLLGDFGAEVMKIEVPAGDSSRQRGPFPDGKTDPEASGLFLYLNINKYGACLDIERRNLALDDLLARADIFITNFSAEALARADIRPTDLRARYPQLVVTTISPFGSTGPWANRKGDDLVTFAMSGMAYSTPGMPDAADDLEREPPLHPGCFVGETIAGLVAAMGTLSAVLGPRSHARRLSCRGQPAGRDGGDADPRHHLSLIYRPALQPASQSRPRLGACRTSTCPAKTAT